MPSLSYQEKSLYGSLLVDLIVYPPYFFLNHQNSVDKVAGMIAAIIVLQIILQSLIAGFSRNRITDERDQLVLLRGYRAGYFAIVSLMCFGLGLLWIHATLGNLDPRNHNMGLHFLNVFFGILVIADVVKTVAQLIAYRRAL